MRCSSTRNQWTKMTELRSQTRGGEHRGQSVTGTKLTQHRREEAERYRKEAEARLNLYGPSCCWPPQILPDGHAETETRGDLNSKMGQKEHGDRIWKPKARSNVACRNYILTYDRGRGSCRTLKHMPCGWLCSGTPKDLPGSGIGWRCCSQPNHMPREINHGKLTEK